jgi:hypothetical protein
MKAQIVKLEPYEDVASVRDRLSFVQAERVLLVLPRDSAILQRRLDLILILRELARKEARLALVTRDPVIIDHATGLNLSTFPTVDAARTGRWKRPTSGLLDKGKSTPRAEQPDRADLHALQEVASRLRQPPPEHLRQHRTARIVTAIMLTMTLLATSYILAPYAKVQVFLARDQLNTTVKIIADPTIAIENVATGHVPAKLVSNILVTRQGQIPTTGKADVPATLASGTIILSNQTPDPVSVPVGTIVATLGARPARFRTLKDVLLNGYGNAEVTIAATNDSAGPVGNIEANLITQVEGALSGKLAVRNALPTQGGTIRQQGIVTKPDQDRLLALVRDQIRTNALADIALTPTQFIAPGSIQIVEERPEWTTFSNFIGDPGDTLTLTLKVRIQALVIDELPARKVAYASLARQLANRQIVVESVQYQRGRVDPVDAKGMASFLFTASGEAVNSVNADAIRARLTGMGVSDARAVLDREVLLDPRRPPQIDVSPGFLGRLPLLGVRIDVEVR